MSYQSLFLCLLAGHLFAFELVSQVTCDSSLDTGRSWLKRRSDELAADNSYYEDDTEQTSFIDIPRSEEVENLRATYWSKFGGVVQRVMAPTTSYITLITRYHKWYQTYKELQKESGDGQIRDAMDVLKEEYAKVDEEILKEQMAEAEENEANRTDKKAKPFDPKQTENIDFVFKVLSRLIDRLEAILKELEENEGVFVDALDDEIESNADTSMESDDYERTKRAMDRVKRTAVKTATNLVTNELMVVAKIASINALAAYLSTRPVKEGDPLGYLIPIIQMVGKTNVPFVVRYLKDVQFRAALAVINQLNPISYLMNRRRTASEAIGSVDDGARTKRRRNR